MNYLEIFNILGPEWHDLKPHTIDGELHWAACRMLHLLHGTSTTWIFRGPKNKPRMQFPLYRKHFVPDINDRRSINMVTMEAILLAIKHTKKCWPYRVALRENGIKI